MKSNISILSKLGTFCLCLLLVVQVQRASSQMTLPKPDTKGGIPLMQAITQRQTNRSFDEKDLDASMISNILYAAWGVTHDGKHTIPTSMNKQDLDVYVLLKSGTFKYNPVHHVLEKISIKDNRGVLATQNFVKKAPMTLVYVGKDPQNAPLHAGSAYQNVGLYAASAGLNNVVRTGFDKGAVKKVLKLSDDENVIVSQTLGWPQK